MSIVIPRRMDKRFLGLLLIYAALTMTILMSVHVSGDVTGTLADEVAVTNVVCSKTVVGQGYVLFITVSVMNLGDVEETFNVTAYYDQTPITIEEWPDGANSQVFWSMGDVNYDGYIDYWDIHRIVHAFGTNDPVLDINSDGIVNMKDIGTCASHYGQDIWTSLNLSRLIQSERPVTLASGNSANVTFRWNTRGVVYGDYTISSYAWPVPGETNTADNTFIDGVIYVGIPGDIDGDGFADIFDAILLAGRFNYELYHSVWNTSADISSDANVDIYDAIILAGNFGKSLP